MIRIHNKGIPYKITAICRHCGEKKDLDEYKVVMLDSVDGNIICSNKNCDALDDPGMWLSVERI